MQVSEIKELKRLQAKATEYNEYLKMLEVLASCTKAEVLTNYDAIQSYRSFLWTHLKQTYPGTDKYDRSPEADAEFDRLYGRDNEKFFAVIRLYAEKGVDFYEYKKYYEKTGGLVASVRWGSSGPWDDDRYQVLLVPVKTKERLTLVCKKIREYAPDIKITHTYYVTEEI